MSFETEYLAKDRAAKRSGEKVGCAWVRCNGFRCMAYQDKEKKWRGFFDDKELAGPIEVLQVL